MFFVFLKMLGRSQIVFIFFNDASLFLCCMRELYFPVLPSKDTLLNSSGNCLPKTIMGSFVAGKNTNDSNFIQVSVHVTQGGNFAIASDTVNGFSFNSTGNFADTGLVSIKLAASGTPTAADTSVFTIRYKTSDCTINVPVTSATPQAIYTLLGAPDTCTPVTVSGGYIKDVSLGADDIVTISLQATAPGSYSISTNEINGYKFFDSSTVVAGIQTIKLKSIGAPLAKGTDHFTVTAGGSSCTFTVTVYDPVIVTGTDYFPLSLNSYWTYEDVMNAGDTIKRIITGDSAISSTQYRVMHEYDRYGGDTAFLFRKKGTDYIQNGSVDILTVALAYVPHVIGQINFLKQPLTDGESWVSEECLGNLFSGQPVYLQYYFNCVKSNDAITVGTHSFINVYHVILLPQIKSSASNPYNSTNEVFHLYYAKGIGLVYVKGTDNVGFPKKEWRLRNWLVN